MENWTEIKTAYLLGRLGTVSATAEAIGVHRATVIRRIESLEGQLGGKLFQRHSKGYNPTDLGVELIRVAERSDDSFRTLILKARKEDQELSGDFVISCPELLDHYMFFAVRLFKTMHPNISIHFRPSNEVLKLEYGDADVALALGEAPDHPDYVVRPLREMPVGLYCSILRKGQETDPGALANSCSCRFVRSAKSAYGKAVERWTKENVRDEQIVLTSTTVRGANDAVLAGLGAGFLPVDFGNRVKWVAEVMPPLPDWTVPIWIVTHVDLHRSAKIQSFLNLIKNRPEEDGPRVPLVSKRPSTCLDCGEFCELFKPQKLRTEHLGSA